MNSTEIFLSLLKHNKRSFEELQWPNSDTFEVVVGAILVQNTTWKNTQKALSNLNNANLLSLDAIAGLDITLLADLIKPSGFYNTKAKRLYGLAKAIKKDFDDFENFRQNVTKEWLLGIKGIGSETCDAILCYACGRAEMVVDAYALRILNALGYEFESYDEAKEWLASLDFDKVYNETELFDELGVFRLYHSLIMEFCKDYSKGKKLDNDMVKLYFGY
ncbi:3-methyladenine DNA glycosylase [Campylobacter pinnipediorum subsp. pinnipediorum]|uniref:3-methyladenine DNA glycosylase n=1 Tax=Campylobacter pinnipediorum TaxID=1965231 RepID=UPI000995C696|nr:3-methyladenine DNA glycosylase [Campylobacter pinnipediorum]AQW83914.1 3-methyladenine DNA glycosylase [Campylobacter pinnipediorum subsp. pinnipediorum]